MTYGPPTAPSALLLTSLAATLLLGGCGGSSSSAPSPPAAPTGLTATPGNAEAILEWDPVEGAEGYNLYWAPAATGIDLENPDAGDAGWAPMATSPETVTELENYQDIVFAVTAVAEGLESAPSDEVTTQPAPGLSGYSIESNDSTLPAGEYSLAGASCGDRIPVSGGIRASDVDVGQQPGLDVQESWPDQISLGGGSFQNVWGVRAFNDSGEDRDVTAYAICIDPPDGLEVVDRDIFIDSGEEKTATLECPEDSGLVMLGAGLSHNLGGAHPDVRINASEPTFARSDSWTFRLVNDVIATRTVTLRGLCSLPPRGYQRLGSGGPSVASGEYAHESSSACNGPPWADPNTVVLAGAHGGHQAHPAALRLEQSYPSEDGTHWHAGVFNTGSGASGVTWYRNPLCAIQDP